MRKIVLWLVVVLALHLLAEESSFAGELNFSGEKLVTLKSGKETYSNVTITAVTATDIFFTYSGGMGNVKLKKLDPELQKHFHFDPMTAAEVESRQKQASASLLMTPSNGRREKPTSSSVDSEPYISVQAADEAVQYQVYDPIYGRPSELGGHNPAKVVGNFDFDANFTVQTISEKEPFAFRIEAVKISIGLPIRVIMPSTPVERLKNYLEGYRQIYEGFYERGPKAAERAARSVGSGRSIVPRGNDVESAKSDFVAKAKRMAKQEYFNYTWNPAIAAIRQYNILTDYSLGLKDASEAKEEVLRQFEVPVPDN